jgi:CRISPR-associated protein Cmr4
MDICGHKNGWNPEVGNPGECLSLGNQQNGEHAILENYKLKLTPEPSSRDFISWLSENALAAGAGSFFSKKNLKDTLLVHDEIFNHFVKHGTLVEPHVRIVNMTGTAQDGALFYVENLPPETLLFSILMTSRVRERSQASEWPAGKVLEQTKKWFDGKLVQLGGDATTGRGHVLLNIVQNETTEEAPQ